MKEKILHLIEVFDLKRFIKFGLIGVLNTLVDFFGPVPQYTRPGEDGTTEVTMSIAPEGVRLFALQYADQVEVLEPEWLREKIGAILTRNGEKYSRS